MLSRVFALFFVLLLGVLGANEASVFNKNPLQITAPQKPSLEQNKTRPKNNAQNFNNVVLNPNELRNIAGSDEPDVSGAELYEKKEPIKIELEAKLLNKEVYIYEPFGIELTLKGDSLAQFRPELSLKLKNAKNLNPKVRFVDIAKNESKATLWFIAYSDDANIDDIAVVLKRGGEFALRQSVESQTPLIKPLAQKDDFCNVVASSLVLKSFKASKFDEFNNLITLELEATNATLSEFKVPLNGARGGVDNIKGGETKTTATYSLIAPSEAKKITFSYFNSTKNAFETIEALVKPASNDLSTQTSLNPVTSEFAAYKSIAVYVLIILCLLSFMLWRSYYGLVLAVIFGAYAFYDARPFAGANIKAGSAVTILPVHGSSVFYKPSSDEKVQVLLSQEKYTKILLDNGKIGWVRNENIK